MSKDFKNYIHQVKLNTKEFADTLQSYGVYCSNSDNHLMYIDTYKSFNMTGKEAQEALSEIDITVNKNMLPHDKLSPALTSGIRIGFAALTTRGCTEYIAHKLASIIFTYLKMYNYLESSGEIKKYKQQVKNIVSLLKGV